MSMPFQEALNEAMAAAREGRLLTKTDKELDTLLLVCRQYCAANPHSRVTDPTIDSLCEEISRRTNEKNQIERQEQHKAAIGETQKLHSAVVKLQKPHWSLTPTFWISLGVLIVSVAILIVTVLGWLYPIEKKPQTQVVEPASKAASFQLPEPKSQPASPTEQQTSPVESVVTQGTNHPAK